MDNFKTDKIGLVSYLMMQGYKVLGLDAGSTRNRSFYIVDIDEDRGLELQQDFMNSEFAKFYENFRYLRERAIQGK